MKNLLNAVIVILVFTISSCEVYYQNEEDWQLPCERDAIGNVCFENDTHRKVKVATGDTEFEVAAYSTICVDMYEGDYGYKVKQGFHRWRGDIFVYPCEQYFVELYR